MLCSGSLTNGWPSSVISLSALRSRPSTILATISGLLPSCARLLGEDLALLGEHLGRHVRDADVARIAGRHVHRQIMRQRGACRPRAPPARRCACRARRRRAAPLALEHHAAAHADVLADLRDQRATALRRRSHRRPARAASRASRSTGRLLRASGAPRRPRSGGSPARARRNRSRS